MSKDNLQGVWNGHVAKNEEVSNAQPDSFESLGKRWRESAEWMTPETPHGYQSGRIGQLKECTKELEALAPH